MFAESQAQAGREHQFQDLIQRRWMALHLPFHETSWPSPMLSTIKIIKHRQSGAPLSALRLSVRDLHSPHVEPIEERRDPWRGKLAPAEPANCRYLPKEHVKSNWNLETLGWTRARKPSTWTCQDRWYQAKHTEKNVTCCQRGLQLNHNWSGPAAGVGQPQDVRMFWGFSPGPVHCTTCTTPRWWNQYYINYRLFRQFLGQTSIWYILILCFKQHNFPITIFEAATWPKRAAIPRLGLGWGTDDFDAKLSGHV